MAPRNRKHILSRSRSRWLALGLFLLALTGPLATGWQTLLGCDPFAINDASLRLPLSFAFGPAFATLGSLIVVYRPQNRIGWLCLLIAFLPWTVAADLYVQCGLDGTISSPGKEYVAWFLYAYSSFGIILLLFLLPLVYPTGRFISPLWRRFAIVCLITEVLIMTGLGMLPDLSQSNGMDRFPLANPFGELPLPEWWFSLFYTLFNLGFVFLNLVGAASIVVRFRRSVGDERQQIKWLAYFLSISITIQMLVFNLPGAFFAPQIYDTVWFALVIWANFLGFPVVIGIAIFKYRLYAIDLIINRTLVYGGLTLLITAAYLIFVGGIGMLAANQSGQVIGTVLATVIVAGVIRPVYRTLQATANRLVAVPMTPPIPAHPPLANRGRNLPVEAINITHSAGKIERERMTHASNLSPSATKESAKTIADMIPKASARWLVLLIWVPVAALFPTFLAFDIVRDYPHILAECQGALGMFGGCDQLALSSAEIAVLSSWGLTLSHYASYMIALVVLAQLLYLSLGLLILRQQGLSRLGLTVSLGLIVIPFSMYSGGDEFGSIHANLAVPGAVVSSIGSMIMVTFLYLVPNGRFSPRWAYIPLLVNILLFTPMVLEFVVPFPDWIESLGHRALVIFVILGMAFQIYRYVKEATQEERQQTKWIIFGVVSLAAAVLLWVPVFGGELTISSGRARLLANVGTWTLIYLGKYFLPIAITIAILRYKLWNIDLIINRTLVYGGLTVMVALIYFLTVGGLGLLFHASGNSIISLLATALIAIAFQPARERLQRGINRLMFGQRNDPYAVLSHLNQQLQTTVVPAETLNSIVETIAATLKLPYAAIELVEQEAQIGQASVGEPLGEVVELPLRYQNERVGRLLVSPRSPSEHFTPQEEQLLADIAAQTGSVASATRLTLALQRSREQLVLAREEERRRIRRDLHDGLGPTLASQTLKLDMVLETLNGASPAAVDDIKLLKEQTQQMVVDIRRLVYELRPPALDELGLLEALRSHVAQLSSKSGSLQIAIDAAPEPLPALPAAIEVAAYRVALEAVTNVIRHAQAKVCRVRFEIAEDEQPSTLLLTVTDDGIGMPVDLRAGVGLISMRERAEELGGTCTIESNPSGGTQVSATLPIATSKSWHK